MAMLLAFAALLGSSAAATAQSPGTATPRAPLARAPFLLDAPATATAPQRKTTPHLELQTRPLVDASRSGGVRLVVEVRPHAGMRLYAPEEQDYVGVALVLDAAQPARLGAATLPTPSLYVFPPTGERNRVFREPFTLEVPVIFESGGRGRPDRLTGRFEYQACDDTLCYKPVRIPLSWKVG